MKFSRRSRTGALLSAALAVLITPALLFAHARLVKSTPSSNERVTASPSTLGLWFSERPELRFTTVQLLDSAGVGVSLGTLAAMGGDSMGVRVAIPTSLPNGRYTVAWRTAAADGHPSNGRYSFVVAAAPSVAPAPPATVVSVDTTRPLTPQGPRKVPNAVLETAPRAGFSTAVRWAELVAVLTLIGATVFRLFVLPEASLSAETTADVSDRVRRLANAVLVLFVVSTFWRLSGQADLVVGAAPGRLSSMMTVALDTRWGRGWLIGAIGALVAAGGLLLARRGVAGWVLTALGIVAICVGEGLTGHAAALMNRAALATAIDLAHLLGVGGWMGGLVIMVFCALPGTSHLQAVERTSAGQRLVRSYHRAATECVALVLITAALGAWLRLSAPSDLWTTTYGRILLLKITLAVVLLGFGWHHWRRIVTPVWTDDTGFRFKRSAMAELLIGAVAVGATAMLVSTALPHL